jgi:hypothetical protein
VRGEHRGIDLFDENPELTRRTALGLLAAVPLAFVIGCGGGEQEDEGGGSDDDGGGGGSGQDDDGGGSDLQDGGDDGD